MAGEVQVTLTGNLTSDPESRQAGGATVASFSVAVTGRKYDRQAGEFVEGATTFYRCSAWRELGEHAVSSLGKGDRVIVVGSIEERPWTDKEGVERRSMEVTVEEIGPSLRFATATVERAVKNANQQARGQQRAQQGGQRQQPQRQQARPAAQQDWSAGGNEWDDTPF